MASPAQRRLTALLLGTLLLSTLPAAAHADSLEQRVVDLTNAERARQGLAPLALSAELAQSARGYGTAMALGAFFAHVGPDGSTFITRDEGAGYQGWTFVGENLAAGQVTPEQVVAAWLNSPTHRANLLSPRPREIGVGHVYQPGSPYGHYWVQELGSRPGEQALASRVQLALLGDEYLRQVGDLSP